MNYTMQHLILKRAAHQIQVHIAHFSMDARYLICRRHTIFSDRFPVHRVVLEKLL